MISKTQSAILRPTLAQVAKKAGVAPSTASEAINGRKDGWMSKATRQRVLDAAASLEYRPNLAAQAMRKTKTKTIGLVTNGFGSPAKEWRTDGFCDAATGLGYDVMMTYSANDPVVEDRLILRHLDRQVDGIAIYPTERGPHAELKKLVDSGFPVVIFDSKTGGLDFACDWVGPDYAGVGRLQAEHLLSLGARRICIARSEPSALINVIREDAVRQAIQEAGLPPPLEECPQRPSSGMNARF